jgi:hypothetical protein
VVEVGLVGDVDVVSVGLGSVVVGVVVVVVGVVSGVLVVVLGRSCTLVRGTQVYSGSGTNPGGTTAVSGTTGAGGGGAYALCTHAIAKNATMSPTVDVRMRPLMR